MAAQGASGGVGLVRKRRHVEPVLPRLGGEGCGPAVALTARCRFTVYFINANGLPGAIYDQDSRRLLFLEYEFLYFVNTSMTV